MAKNGVDGVYDADPRTTPGARKYRTLSYLDALSQRLEVMDSTALTLCMDNALPIVVFDLAGEDAILQAVLGAPLGTVVQHGTSTFV
jgi:uridylate kinase